MLHETVQALNKMALLSTPHSYESCSGHYHFHLGAR